MNIFPNRFKELKSNKNVTYQQIAEYLSLQMQTVKFYASGKVDPPSSKLIKLADYFDVSLDYLVGRSDNPKVNPALLDEKTEILNEAEQTNDEIQYIKKYRSLDSHGKEVVDLVLNSEYNRVEEPTMIKIPYMEYEMEHEMEEPQEMIDIDYSFTRVSAGTGILLNDDEEIIKIKVPLTDASRRADFAVSVRGGSMEPRYCDGDLLLVRQQPAIDPGEIGIFIVNNEGFVKKLGQGELISLNDKYENIPLHEYDEIRCIGKIEGAIPEKEAKRYIF